MAFSHILNNSQHQLDDYHHNPPLLLDSFMRNSWDCVQLPSEAHAIVLTDHQSIGITFRKHTSAACRPV